MRKVIVSVYSCIPGMKTAESIHNEYGAVIIARNTIIDEHIIRKLTNLNINRITVYDEGDNIISANSIELFKAQYNENVEVVKELIHDISAGKSVDIKKIDMATDSIIIRINENRDIISCINQMKTADTYTYMHSVNVSLLCMMIGKWMNLKKDSIKKVVQAGLLHDIGKSMVPPDVLNKPGTLTAEEFEEIKKHALYGYRIIEKVHEISKDVCLGILMHHEREDGSGYPIGAKSEQINQYAKIIAVADTYDAMTSDRVYKLKESPFEAFDEIKRVAFGVLDTKVINAFLSNIAAYYIGDFVKLNTGENAEIIYINPSNISRPIVKVGEKFIDLIFENKIKITGLI